MEYSSMCLEETEVHGCYPPGYVCRHGDSEACCLTTNSRYKFNSW